MALFLRRRVGVKLDEQLSAKSGTIIDLAVCDLAHRRPIKNKEALANPEALDLYVDIAELKS